MRAAAVAAAWLPSLFVWVAFASVYVHVTLFEAFVRGVLTIGSAALLGTAVTWFCSTTAWPRDHWMAFYAKHLCAAGVYGAAWLGCLWAFDRLLGGTPIWFAHLTWVVLAWYGVIAFWLYAAVAGVSYAVRSQHDSAESKRRAVQLEASLAAARLDALRSRVHPHFLFNALHTIGALVRVDQARAENAVEKLGDILRYTLRDTNGDAVPFADEWEFTCRYLEFEQLRYGDRLVVRTAIDPASMQWTAPFFALQTLVENAVRHSIDARPGGGRIEISARPTADALEVLVRDDGGNGLPSQDGSHYGLAALRERLHAAYGERARLQVTSGEDAFEVSLTIPARRLADDEE